ncbi:MAG: hypothetical protein K0V04_18510 [Deltaproteobacteria bacterium]|nr:hypothetical protein [Deltaproteobacteria bacterium]
MTPLRVLPGSGRAAAGRETVAPSLLAGLDGDGDKEIVVATYGQVSFVLDGTFVAE